jgi:hypothetical protein
MGIFSESTQHRLQELEQQRRVLSFEIAQEEIAQPTFTADHIRFWLHQLRELNPQKLEHRRRLINSFVNAVYLYDDYLVFVGNYKDSTKTITFAELEEIGLGSDAFASGVPKNKRGLLPSLIFLAEGTRIIKSDSPVDCRSMPAGRHRNLNFLPPQREKMQTSPFLCTKQYKSELLPVGKGFGFVVLLK